MVTNKDSKEKPKNINKASRLDKLTSNLMIIVRTLSCFTRELFKLMKHKSVYQCEYMNCWKKLEVTKLPPSNAVHSELDMKGINDQEYEHAQHVWNALGNKYHRLLSRHLLENRWFTVGKCI